MFYNGALDDSHDDATAPPEFNLEQPFFEDLDFSLTAGHETGATVGPVLWEEEEEGGAYISREEIEAIELCSLAEDASSV